MPPIRKPDETRRIFQIFPDAILPDETTKFGFHRHPSPAASRVYPVVTGSRRRRRIRWWGRGGNVKLTELFRGTQRKHRRGGVVVVALPSVPRGIACHCLRARFGFVYGVNDEKRAPEGSGTSAANSAAALFDGRALISSRPPPPPPPPPNHPRGLFNRNFIFPKSHGGTRELGAEREIRSVARAVVNFRVKNVSRARAVSSETKKNTIKIVGSPTSKVPKRNRSGADTAHRKRSPRRFSKRTQSSISDVQTTRCICISFDVVRRISPPPRRVFSTFPLVVHRTRARLIDRNR